MSAVISDCGKFRFVLGRQLNDPNTHRLLYIMLNPSTADASIDDPTIRRCTTFALKHGYTSFEVVNLFAFRTPSPKVLADAGYPSHRQEYEYAVAAMKRADAICCAWGAIPKGVPSLVAGLMRNLALVQRKPMVCLGKTKDGHPRHPLYLPNSATFQEF